MPDLLLELFSEEIPARMQRPATQWWQETLGTKLREARLEMESLRMFVSPRRLAVIVKGLPHTQPDLTVERKGPKIGAPEQAIRGFLKSAGIGFDQLEQRGEGKEACYYAMLHQKGQPAGGALKAILEEMIASYTWPKSMRWGGYQFNWVRPLHNILCLFDGKILPLAFHHLEANANTYGHRFLAPGVLRIDSPNVYEDALEHAKVHVCADRRRDAILKQAQELAASKNLTLKEDTGLIDEVTGLVEWPVVLTGTIDATFMDLPPEVLATVMKSHQKYLALYTADGKLSANFLIVSNMETDDKGAAIVAGNERVLRARFSDARFFWDQDRKRKLEDWAKDLSNVTYHARIGTVAEKVSRIEALAATIAGYVPDADRIFVARAAGLAKADLVTGMVGEFAELQGLMGRYYALAQNEPQEVADAIRDHYLPLGPDSPVPAQPVSICVALADKLDMLISMFAIGEKPTGSKDPFALRRAGLGTIRIILRNKIALPLLTLSGMTPEIIEFLYDRLRIMLRDQGKRYDLVNAVLDKGQDDDLLRIVAKTEALSEFLNTEEGRSLLAGYKRAANILAIEEKKDKKVYGEDADPNKLGAAEAEALYDAVTNPGHHIPLMVQHEDARFIEALKMLAALRAPIDLFFDKVLVNDKDPAIRENRLKLLAMFTRKAGIIANFSLIEG